jgi:NADH-quinone oxidoreductase subunit B
MGIETQLGNNVLTTSLEKLVNWARRSSLWPAGFGLACCALEMLVAVSARYDMARFGMEVFRPSPRQADLMIVAGTVTKKMLPAVVRSTSRREPKMGHRMRSLRFDRGSSIPTLRFRIDQYLPVDVYIPRLPPRPEGLLWNHPSSHEKIDREKLLER